MMLIPTVVRPSIIPGAGLGLFAAEDVPAGAILWRWLPPWDRPFSLAEVARFDAAMVANLNKYGWRHGDEWRVSLDDSRFTNHSRTRKNTRHVLKLEHHYTVATRAIRAGEEILEDYAEFDPDFHSYAHLLTESSFRDAP